MRAGYGQSERQNSGDPWPFKGNFLGEDGEHLGKSTISERYGRFLIFKGDMPDPGVEIGKYDGFHTWPKKLRRLCKTS